MMRTNFFAGVCAAVVAAGTTGCALLGGSPAESTPRASLAGDWMLDAAASSDTGHASVRALEWTTQPEPAAAGSATRTGGTSAERLRAARIDHELAARVLAAARSRIERLAIADSAGTITLRSGDGGRVVLATDGRTTRQQWLDGTTAELRARWVQHRLEIVRRLDGGITVQEYYARSPGAARLVVFAIVKGPFEGEIADRRVYSTTG